jgi:hypothetical protein
VENVCPRRKHLLHKQNLKQTATVTFNFTC